MNNGMNNTNYNSSDNSGMNNQNFNNQPVNNGMSNQNFNGQVNNTMPNQGYNGQVNSGMNNQNFNNQPMNNGMANQNFNSQPVNNVMPNQPINNDVSAIKQNKKPIYIIIGVALLTIVVVGVLFFVNNNGTISGGTEEKVETITYKGFSIPKKAGYTYNLAGDSLGISKDRFMLALTIVAVSFEDVKNESDSIVTQFEAQGWFPNNFKIATYNGKEVATMEVIMGGNDILYCIMDAGNNNIFMGGLYDSATAYNYDNVNTFVSLLKDAKYTGSKATSSDTDLSSIQDFLNGLGK